MNVISTHPKATPHNCVLCGSTDTEQAVLTEAQLSAAQNVPPQLPYRACAQCGLWFQPEPPAFKFEADDRAGTRRESALVEKASFVQLARRLARELAPTSAVLDVGASYPLLLHLLKKEHSINDVLGIDGCSKTPEYAEELNIPMVQADFLSHSFGALKFDLITMLHVIEHFCNPLVPALKMKSLLRTGGKIFIRTPLNDTVGLSRWHLTKFHFQVHPIVFGQSSLRRLFEMAGFRLVNESVSDAIGHGDYDFQVR